MTQGGSNDDPPRGARPSADSPTDAARDDATLPVDPATGEPPSSADSPSIDPTLPIGAAPSPSTAPAFGRIEPPRGFQPRRFGDYELLAEIAHGGMGIVYKARQLGLNRLVALKMILSGSLAGEQEVLRFAIEVEAAAHLEHPGIVPIYEVGQIDGCHFYSMALVEGGSLADRLADGPLTPNEAAVLLQKIACTVEFAHQKGFIHRDLKPANVLLEKSGEPRITDFGLAKRFDDPGASGHTASGQVLGTPGYMPPEQAGGRVRELGPPADVYSLGAILYALLTGRPPFQAGTVMDTLLQVLEQPPAPPRLLNPAVPRDLESICLKCLAKPIAERYPSAAALADDLQSYLEGRTVRADSTAAARFLRGMLRETRHSEVMTLWGRVWELHGWCVLVFGWATNVLIWRGVTEPWAFLLLWIPAMLAFSGVVWKVRFLNGPPLAHVERQGAVVWGMFLVVFMLTGLVNHMIGLPPLTLTPVVVLQCAFALGCTGVVMGGSFYPLALLCAALALALPLIPDHTPAVFGTLFAAALLTVGRRNRRPRGERQTAPLVRSHIQ